MLDRTRCLVEVVDGAFRGRLGISSPVNADTITVAFDGETHYRAPASAVHVIATVEHLQDLLSSVMAGGAAL